MHRPQQTIALWASGARCLFQRRTLTLAPDRTVDPRRYPLGYVPLSGKEAVDVLYRYIREGHYITSTSRFQDIDKAFHAVSTLLESEFPAETFDDLVVQREMKHKLLSKVLIPRSFYDLDDWNNAEMFYSYGPQNRYFDRYLWTQKYCHDFKDFAERHFPIAEHTHLTYPEYQELMRYFALHMQGVNMEPALPRKYRLKPVWGAPIPSKPQMVLASLLHQWMTSWRVPLVIQNALVLRCGLGVYSNTARYAGVKMVYATDPKLSAIEGARANAKRLGYDFRNQIHQVSDLFPVLPTERSPTKMEAAIQRFNCIIVGADSAALEDPLSDCRYPFAPSLSGEDGVLEQVFEEAASKLTEMGVLIILSSNLMDLAYPNRPNVIEREIRQNRRWVLLDYVDVQPEARLRMTTELTATATKSLSPAIRGILSKLRLEMWILHPVDAIPNFGWIHQIPGATPPAAAQRWKLKSMQSQREKMIRQRVQQLGMDWGDYKSRLLSMLRDHGGEKEDETAQAVRMMLDPAYPDELSMRAKQKVEKKLQEENEWRTTVGELFPSDSFSPRNAFDAWANQFKTTTSSSSSAPRPSRTSTTPTQHAPPEAPPIIRSS
jgi:hypothetical protein